ncbi:MAG: hypothetical protein RJA70_224 [Pseudomonadota bacterium]|jgi:serine/threonine-protein kinase
MNQPSEIEVKEGDVLDGKYRVEKILGAGGMGVVVSAQHTVLNNRVALKFLLPSVARSDQTAARFLREAQAAVKIKSPHVARVIDVGTMADSGSPYMVMEYLEGRDLGEVLELQGSLEMELACLYTLQACEALAAAHSCGIVHRDIKPANLFLTMGGDGSPVLKVLDFGISKNTVDMGISNLTQTQISMGSPLYMSPEQMRSARDVDARTDVWSLGVVLFELLTGQLPFMADTMPQLCALVLEERAPLVTQLRSDLPAALAEVIARCLEKKRDDRFGDVAQLAAALAQVVPEWGQPSADRCSRILAGAGVNRTISQFEVPRAALASNSGIGVSVEGERENNKLSGTETAFGTTGPEAPAAPPSKRPLALVLSLVALAGAVLAGAVFAGVLATRQEDPTAITAASAASVGPVAAAPTSAELAKSAYGASPGTVPAPTPPTPTGVEIALPAPPNGEELGTAGAPAATLTNAATKARQASAGAIPQKARPTREAAPDTLPEAPAKKPDPFGDRF